MCTLRMPLRHNVLGLLLGLAGAASRCAHTMTGMSQLAKQTGIMGEHRGRPAGGMKASIRRPTGVIQELNH